MHKAVSQAVHVTAEKGPLVECVALTADPKESQAEIQKHVLSASALTDNDWRKAQHHDYYLFFFQCFLCYQ